MEDGIWKLAHQAGLGIQYDGIVLTKSVDGAEALEHFAELIVKECLKEIKFQYGGGDHPEWNEALDAASDMINYHFFTVDL